jgi:hypothetical protein
VQQRASTEAQYYIEVPVKAIEEVVLNIVGIEVSNNFGLDGHGGLVASVGE